MKTIVKSFCVASILLAGSLAADTLLVQNAGPIWGSTDKPGGAIFIEDGKISGVYDAETLTRARLKAADRTIDAKGASIFPGFFSGYSQLGLVEVSAVNMVNDADEGIDPNTAQMLAMDGYNPQYSTIPVTRINGITNALVAPAGGNVFAGQSAVMSLSGETVGESTDRSPVALHISMGEAPKERYGSKDKAPMTRMGIAAMVRAQFVKAQEYRTKLDSFDEKMKKYESDLKEWESKKDDPEAKEPKKPDPVEKNLQLDPFVKALSGEIPVAFNASRMDDIETSVRLSEEFGLRPVIIGGASAWKLAPMLAEKKVPVILCTTTQPEGMDTQNANYENAKRLHEAGVTIAFYTDDTTHNVRRLPYEAGLAVAYGLPHDAAIAAITSAPAEIWGMSDSLGSIEAGKKANLIFADGDPLQPLTHITGVIIGGEEMPLTTRQSELAVKYGGEHLPESQKPKQ